MRPARYGEGEQVLERWPLANGQELRLTSCYFKHSRFFDLRRWEQDTAGAWQPTPRGVRFSAVLVGPLAEVLTRIAETGRAA